MRDENFVGDAVLTLTDGQEEAMNFCLDHLESEGVALLKGSAGTGKTTLLGVLVETYLNTYPRHKIAVCAPTHKAVAVLKGKIKSHRGRVQFNTVHSAMKLRLKRDPDTGDLVLAQGRENGLEGVHLLIVDEGSMVNRELSTLIEEHGIKVLYVGDDKQLNPVKEGKSPVFTKEYPTAELTEIMRQAAENPIIHLSRNLHLLDEPENMETEDAGYIYTFNEPKIVDTLAGESGTVYLAWTNNCVDRMNRSVRHYKYGHEVEEYVVGETVMFNAHHKDYKNSDQVTITHVKERQIPIFVDSERHMINAYELNHGDFIVVAGSSKALWKRLLKKCWVDCKKRVKKWSEHEKMEGRFADVSYTYALTTHKAQGSEWDTVIINVADMELNSKKEEREALLYTAITRAKKTLIIYGKT